MTPRIQNKRILLIQPYVESGGAHLMNYRLANFLSRSGWEFNIAVLFSGKAENDNLPNISKLNFINLNAHSLPGKLFLPLRLACIARRHDLVLAGMEVAATNYGYAAARIALRPFLAWTHTNFQKHESLLPLFDRMISHAIYRKIKHVVFPSQGARDSLATALGSRPSNASWHVIENFHEPCKTELVQLPPPAHLTQGMLAKPILIAVGRLAPVKAFDRLLRAHAALIGQGLEHYLIIVGEGPERERLQLLTQKLNIATSTVLPGHIENITPWLKQSAVFALCSDYEGCPMAILEAMDAGVPVVSMDCPNGPRELLDNGSAGILTPDGDEPAFQAALAKMLVQPELRRHYAAIGRMRASLYTPERILPRWEILLNQIISSHQHRF